MSREHPRPGAEHARRLREAQEKAQALRRTSDLPQGDPPAPGVLEFLLGLVERRIAGPYRVGDHLLVLGVTGPDSAWVSEHIERLKSQLLRLCRTPVQDGLCVGPYLGDQGCDYDEDSLPF